MLPRLLFVVVLSTSCSGTPAERPAPDAVPQGRLRGGTLAVVRGGGLAPVVPGQQWVAVTPTSIDVDGRTVVALVDGDVPAAALGDAQYGNGVITALGPELRSDRLTLYVDRDSAFRLVSLVVWTVGTRGVQAVEVVVAGSEGERVLALPLRRHEGTRAEPALEPPPLGLVVGEYTKEKNLRMFALEPRGPKGGWTDPYVVLPIAADGSFDAAALRASAVEVAASLGPWPRRHEDQVISLLFDERTPFQRVVSIVDAVRRAADGTPLFPIVEMAGFQTRGFGVSRVK